MSDWLTSGQIVEIFTEEIESVRGKVRDPYVDRTRVFIRAVLPVSVEVAPGDKHKGGVAMYASDRDIFVHPFVLRVICKNGMVYTETKQTVHVAWHDLPEDAGDCSLEQMIRDAIRHCCAREAFQTTTRRIRSTREFAADSLLRSMEFSRQRDDRVTPWVEEAMHRYHDAKDYSAYGLMNAITSVARDTRDPQEKWDLEKLGGMVPALVYQRQRKAARARSAVRSLVTVQ